MIGSELPGIIAQSSDAHMYTLAIVMARAGLRGEGNGSNFPGPPVMKFMFQIKYSFEKFS